MKRQFLFLLLTVFSLNCFSQIYFEKGYYINNSDEKIECLIKNNDWEHNPTEFNYKLSDQSEPKKASIESVKEFGIYSVSKYIRSTVDIDRSSDNLAKATIDRKPLFKEEQLFLKVLVEGEASLYEYVGGNVKRYFYSKEDSSIEQLVFKIYLAENERDVRENNTYKQQLWNNLKCSDFKMSKLESIDYKKNDLINFFVEYSECNQQTFVNFEQKQKKDLFNLSITPRLVGSSLTFDFFDDSRDVDFGYNASFGIGIEAEFVLPFNKNKWALIIEPTYQKLELKKTGETGTNWGGELTTKVKYSSIEIPLGIRHYFFLNDKSKIFVNAFFIRDVSFNSSVEYVTNDETELDPLEIKTLDNFAIGFGYKNNDRYSIELRYQTYRALSIDHLYRYGAYNSLSIILGYSFL